MPRSLLFWDRENPRQIIQIDTNSRKKSIKVNIRHTGTERSMAGLLRFADGDFGILFLNNESSSVSFQGAFFLILMEVKTWKQWTKKNNNIVRPSGQSLEKLSYDKQLGTGEGYISILNAFMGQNQPTWRKAKKKGSPSYEEGVLAFYMQGLVCGSGSFLACDSQSLRMVIVYPPSFFWECVFHQGQSWVSDLISVAESINGLKYTVKASFSAAQQRALKLRNCPCCCHR